MDRVTVALNHGRLHALIGPNGAGKTTLFNLLSGMFEPDSGELRIQGEVISEPAPERMVERGIARSFQITNLFQGLTVFENLRLGVQAHHPRRFNLWLAKERLEDVNQETRALIKFLGLEGVEQAQVGSLSYGGQRLLEIGLALTARPKLLLLDEPLAGLAAAERERIVAMIRKLALHMGVLIVEHDIDRVFEFADAITVMADGAVLVEGSAEAVQADAKVQEVYLGSGRKAIAASGTPAAPDEARSGAPHARGRQHLLREEPHPARCEPHRSLARGDRAPRPQRRGEVLDLQDDHGHRAAGQGHA